MCETLRQLVRNILSLELQNILISLLGYAYTHNSTSLLFIFEHIFFFVL